MKKSQLKESIKSFIKTLMEQDDEFAGKIHAAQIKRDEYDLIAKKVSYDRAKSRLKSAEEQLRSAKNNRKEDVSAEEAAVAAAKKELSSANEMVSAATQKLSGTKKGSNIIS